MIARQNVMGSTSPTIQDFTPGNHTKSLSDTTMSATLAYVEHNAQGNGLSNAVDLWGPRHELHKATHEL